MSWSPVVYGRTRRADRWWRAVPVGVSYRGWLGDTVHAVVAGGTLLERGPRFMLARGDDHVLVGVACRAETLSKTMNCDQDGRPLYCFVGWLAPAGQTAGAPPLAELEQHHIEWAGPLYEWWVAPDWDVHDSLVAEQRSDPGPVRWEPAPAPDDGPETRLVIDSAVAPHKTAPGLLNAEPEWVRLVPADSAETEWDSGRATMTPFTLVTGWTTIRDARLHAVTHVSALDVTSPGTAPVPKPMPLVPLPQERLPYDVPPNDSDDSRKLKRFQDMARGVINLLARVPSPRAALVWVRPLWPWVCGSDKRDEARESGGPPLGGDPAQAARRQREARDRNHEGGRDPSVIPPAKPPGPPDSVFGRTKRVDPESADYGKYFTSMDDDPKDLPGKETTP